MGHRVSGNCKGLTLPTRFPRARPPPPAGPAAGAPCAQRRTAPRPGPPSATVHAVPASAEACAAPGPAWGRRPPEGVELVFRVGTTALDPPSRCQPAPACMSSSGRGQAVPSAESGHDKTDRWWWGRIKWGLSPFSFPFPAYQGEAQLGTQPTSILCQLCGLKLLTWPLWACFFICEMGAGH